MAEKDGLLREHSCAWRFAGHVEGVSNRGAICVASCCDSVMCSSENFYRECQTCKKPWQAPACSLHHAQTAAMLIESAVLHIGSLMVLGFRLEPYIRNQGDRVIVPYESWGDHSAFTDSGPFVVCRTCKCSVPERVVFDKWMTSCPHCLVNKHE